MSEDDSDRVPALPNAAVETPDGELLALAHKIQTTMETWGVRMTEAAMAGRSATTVARMATARTTAELRRFVLPDDTSAAGDAPDTRGAVSDYLRRVVATVSRAAREIERNRYSLEAMHSELKRLEQVFNGLSPTATDASVALKEGPEFAGTAGSTDPGGGADDGSADGEVRPG